MWLEAPGDKHMIRRQLSARRRVPPEGGGNGVKPATAIIIPLLSLLPDRETDVLDVALKLTLDLRCRIYGVVGYSERRTTSSPDTSACSPVPPPPPDAAQLHYFEGELYFGRRHLTGAPCRSPCGHAFDKQDRMYDNNSQKKNNKRTGWWGTWGGVLR